jgi:protein TonB
MFETSVIRAEAKAATSRVSLLSASVFAHTAIVVGAVAMSIASVDFPAVAPDEYSRAPIFATVQIPPPLGTPNGGKRPDAQPAVKPPAPQPPREQTAPPLLPNDVPPADTPSTGDITHTDGPFDPNATEVGPKGVEGGDPNSIALDGPSIVDVPAQQPVEEKIYQPHEVVAPVLVHKVAPRYPPQLARTAMKATVIVRCIIDKQGNVRSPEVMVPSQFAPFNAEVLNVLPSWKYKPATVAGRPVDSYLMLTVHFSITR